MLIIDGKRYDAGFNEIPWGNLFSDGGIEACTECGTAPHKLDTTELANLTAILQADKQERESHES